MSSERFKHESIEDAESIVRYLEALQEGFRKGSLLFSTENKRVLVSPSGLINLEVDAKRKDEEVKLTLRLRWTEEATAPSERSGPLNIEALNR